MTKTFLKFVPLPIATGRITPIWDVMTLKDSLLGEIRWFSPWRRFVFFPIPNTLFDAACLAEIADFITVRMETRRVKRLPMTGGRAPLPSYGSSPV